MIDVLCVGHASFDITMGVTSHPASDEKVLADAMQAGGGGPAANAAACIARLGGGSAFLGYLGRDLFGQAHLCELEGEGVDTSLIVRGDAPTPLSQVLAKPDGARSVINFKARTPPLPAVDMPPLPDAKVVLFDGHEPDVSMPLCRQARRSGIMTVLDAGSLHRGTRALAGMVDYLVASEKFARAFSDQPELALKILAEYAETVVITLGKKGLIWNCHGRTGSMAAFRVEVVDSTGAGDAFHGAFAYGLAQGMGWPDLLRYASAAGALTCCRLGARSALPDRAALIELMVRGCEDHMI